MSDDATAVVGLRWTKTLKGFVDLRDGTGALRASLQHLDSGVCRAVIPDGPADDLFAWVAGRLADHPTEALARDWVKSEVARMEVGDGS